MSNILVIGNGFDLDLGLRSRYSDFYNSDFWPFSDEASPLAEFLNQRFKINNWADLESVLGEYGEKSVRFQNQEAHDRVDFRQLREHFNAYILDQQRTFVPNQSSTAISLLKAVVENRDFEEIYSFNFTDLSSIVKDRFGIENNMQVRHIHGRAEDGTSILGVGDYAQLKEHSDFMYKSFDIHYRPPIMIPNLLISDRIVLFGVSMSRVDYQYFDDFFKRVTVGREDDVPADGKEITIFTYDEASRMSILRNLQQMTDHGLGRIFSRNRFQVLCTAPGIHEKEIEDYCQELRDDRWEKRMKRWRLEDI